MGLSGAFAWIAFLSNLITEDRKEAAQQFIDQRVLQNTLTFFALVGLILVFIFGFTFRQGTLLLDTLRDTEDRNVTISTMDSSDTIDERSVAARTETSILLSTEYWGERTYKVKLHGLPALPVKVKPWNRERIVVPSDFLSAPVILLRPTAPLSGDSAKGEFALVVRKGTAEWGRIPKYRGETVWLGATADVDIPSSLADRWSLELMSLELTSEEIGLNLTARLVQRWMTPTSIIGSTALKEGDEITVEIFANDEPETIENRQGMGTTTVRPPSNHRAFPQELVIHGP